MLSDEVRPLLQAGSVPDRDAVSRPASRRAGRRSPPIGTSGDRSTCWSRRPARSRLRSIGATTAKLGDQEIPLVRAFLDLTLPFNLTGQPAISVPCGFTRGGLPIGLQLVGRPFDEATLFRAAAAYESATDWHKRRPPILAEQDVTTTSGPPRRCLHRS